MISLAPLETSSRTSCSIIGMDFDRKPPRIEGIAQKVQGARRGSVALQKHDHPFCSWECVKAWALVNCTPQQKYHTDILIDVAAGYTVAPVPATTMSNTQHL